MPFLIYLLAVAVFAQSTSEFMLAGLLPDIAHDLAISVPQAGLLTSAFAVGMVIGAPLMAVLGRRWSPRWALSGFLALFIISHIVGALSDNFPLLLITRFIAACANAGFLAVTLSTITAMVDVSMRARALAVVLGGTTLALIAGVPTGALIGSGFGWRFTLWAIALISLPALYAIVNSIPTRTTYDHQHSRGVAEELRELKKPLLQTNLLLGILVNAATFCSFTYLAPIVTDGAGLGSHLVSLVLALFGIGSFTGVWISGRLADRHWKPLLFVGGISLVIGWFLFAFIAFQPIILFLLVFIQGGLSFAVGSTLITRIMATATKAPTMGGAFATVSLNIGAVLGPVLGGIAFDLLATPGPLLASGTLALSAFVIGLVTKPVSREILR